MRLSTCASKPAAQESQVPHLVRVLIVDDSAYVRKVIKQILSRSPFIEVVGVARDGEEALELVEELQPDVVTLDLVMPNKDGVTFLREQMARRPIAVIVVTVTGEDADLALEAVECGAIDIIQKPTALANEKVFEIGDALIEKVKVAGATILLHPPMAPPSALKPMPLPTTSGRIDLVVIGISTGGPQALRFLIPKLTASFPVPVAVVLHMPVGYTELYARKLDEIAALHVEEAREGQLLQPGEVLFAPAGRHLSFERQADGTVCCRLSLLPFDTPHRPAVDVLFKSAAQVFGNRILGVVMTGMGSDGKEGSAWIKAQGGKILTEAEESCVVYGMPRSVVEAGLSDRSLPLIDIPQGIVELL
jgi:two-component system chemotaxis response regulator CheB